MAKTNTIVIDLTQKEIVVPSAEIKNRLEGKNGLKPQTLYEICDLNEFKIVRKSSNPTRRKGDNLTFKTIESKLERLEDKSLLETFKNKKANKENFLLIKKWFYEVCPNEKK